MKETDKEIVRNMSENERIILTTMINIVRTLFEFKGMITNQVSDK